VSENKGGPKISASTPLCEIISHRRARIGGLASIAPAKINEVLMQIERNGGGIRKRRENLRRLNRGAARASWRREASEASMTHQRILHHIV